jgi:hypothetical protein
MEFPCDSGRIEFAPRRIETHRAILMVTSSFSAEQRRFVRGVEMIIEAKARHLLTD